MASEIGHIDDDEQALRFALGCVAAALRLRLMADRSKEKVMDEGKLARRAGWITAAAAIGTGLAFMQLGGAPRSFMAVNLLTFILLLVALPALRRIAEFVAARPDMAGIACAAALLATAMLAPPLDGVARWIRVGPISLQLSLILLPAIAAASALASSRTMAAALALAALALALQPDRAMAAALLAAAAANAWGSPNRWRLAALVACTLGVAAAFLRADPMPSVPFVDQLLPHAAAHGAVMPILLGLALAGLIVPFLLAGFRTAGDPVARALAPTWAAIVSAALIGNYPTPLIGFGASAIIGYALSCALIGRRAEAARGRSADRRVGEEGATEAPPRDQNLKAVPT